METKKTDIIHNYLLEVNGYFDEHLCKHLESFCDYLDQNIWISIEKQKPEIGLKIVAKDEILSCAGEVIEFEGNLYIKQCYLNANVLLSDFDFWMKL